MPNFEFTSPQGKMYTISGPDGSTQAQAFAVLQKQLGSSTPSGASSADIPLAPGATQRMAAENANRPPEQQDSILGKIFSPIDAAAAVVTGMAGGMVGMIRGGPLGIPFSNAKNAHELEDEGGKLAESLTYQPRTQAGQKIAGAIGDAINSSGIVGIPIPELEALGRSMSSASIATRGLANANAGAAGAADTTAAAGAGRLRDLLTPPKSDMAGVGAASTADALLRAQRAADLPVPIDLTTGQQNRTFQQQRFERETAKLPMEGAPLRERFANQNQQILQNFDSFIDQTGAGQTALRPVGELVDTALVNKFNEKKAEIRAAYDDARDSGHMSQPVDISPLMDYINDNRSAMKNAPILSSIEGEIDRLATRAPPGYDSLLNFNDRGSATMSINNMEEVRKMINRIAEPGTPNVVYGTDAKRLIDSITDGQGGPKYQQARRMYENFSNEFSNTGVIDKLLSKKPGTNDRFVAYEDVFKHTILNGSLDDVRAVRRTLQTAGADGAQAWKELQGATVSHMKEAMFSNIARDDAGRPIGSPAKLDGIVRNLDADGKLDFIFGKKAAQQIRDANDIAKDIYTSPPGAVNHSNTASVLIGLMDTAISGFTGMPMPIGTTLNYAAKKMKSNAIKNKVAESLSTNPAMPSRMAGPPSNPISIRSRFPAPFTLMAAPRQVPTPGVPVRVRNGLAGDIYHESTTILSAPTVADAIAAAKRASE